MEHNPRVVFERMFGDGGSTDAKARLARMEKNRSILDSVTDKVGSLSRQLGPKDSTKITEYLEAIRDIERRIQRAEEQSGRELPAFDEPAGVPATWSSSLPPQVKGRAPPEKDAHPAGAVPLVSVPVTSAIPSTVPDPSVRVRVIVPVSVRVEVQGWAAPTVG